MTMSYGCLLDSSDQFGNFIKNKHKSIMVQFIRWGELNLQ